MDTPLPYAVPTEIVTVLDDAALILAQLLRADLLPPMWQEGIDAILAQLVAVREKHVWDGEFHGL